MIVLDVLVGALTVGAYAVGYHRARNHGYSRGKSMLWPRIALQGWTLEDPGECDIHVLTQQGTIRRARSHQLEDLE